MLPKSGEQITSEKSRLTVWAADHLHLQFNSAKSLVTCFYLLLVPPKPGEEKKNLNQNQYYGQSKNDNKLCGSRRH